MAKRTLDAFFKPTPAADKRAKTEPIEDGRHPSEHSTYPFPISALPSHIEVALAHGTPARDARIINNQPDLDLQYFQPYIARPTANELFKFLRRELPFYRVQYQIKRAGVETEINTPRYTTVFGVDETATFIPSSPDPDTQDGSGSPEKSASRLTLVDAKTKTAVSASKYQYTPRPIPTCLDHLRHRVEAATGTTYNFCLVNYYASGEDSIAFHSDDERFLGSSPTIASLSLGGEREFQMKHKPVPDQLHTEKPQLQTVLDGNINGGSAKESNDINPSSRPRPNLDRKPLPHTHGTPIKMGLASGDMVIMRGPTQAHWLHSIPKRKGKAGDAVRGRINITFRRAVIPAGTNNYYHYNVGSGGVWRWDEVKREMVLSKG
ncbi:Oxoglutarate/iron-dependent dioxygenase [Penicillium capsulatum]|uniref:Oxoglutarate/iron-dependent dioxygenase n=1 Tax=Penicillium capsulatum TaxID=69766 RepID=A0A9W9HN19_9EURO|nr:Oxoglutarate/iron-dependent dioxygenase [Penicillium capsulatum]KAJ6112436.1 Oxoglutarate/iron-dependent dioxygenase [Penicillium capsulatum]